MISNKTNFPDNAMGSLVACEAALATAPMSEVVIPQDTEYAHIENGVLQVSSDIEEEIGLVDSGEVVSMREFKSIFAKWLD